MREASWQTRMNHMKRQWTLGISLLLAIPLLSCGGNSSPTSPPASTVQFTSVPPSTATEGLSYAYQVTAADSLGNPVTLSLATGPAGASLQGNTSLVVAEFSPIQSGKLLLNHCLIQDRRAGNTILERYPRRHRSWEIYRHLLVHKRTQG